MQSSASESGIHFLQDFRRCETYFYWKYPRALEPKTKAPALIFGTAVHLALAEWYTSMKQGEGFDQRLSKAMLVFRDAMESEREQYFDEQKYGDDLVRGQILLQSYAVEYPNETWEVLAVEEPLEYVFPNGDVFTGRVDLVVKANDRIYIVDHKTTGWSMTSLSRYLQVSDQATGYIWLWNVSKPLPVHGIIFNILRQYKTSNEFRQVLVMKTDEDIERFKRESAKTLNQIAEAVSDPNTVWVHNTNSCFLYNRACPFIELCFGSAYAENLIGTQFKVREGKAQPDDSVD